jgi:hypothetical protein
MHYLLNCVRNFDLVHLYAETFPLEGGEPQATGGQRREGRRRICRLVLVALTVFLCSDALATTPTFQGVQFTGHTLTGIGIAEQNSGPGPYDQFGVGRRDPSDVIRLHDQYYVFYSKFLRDPNGPDDLTPNPQPGFPSGYNADIWYATSTNGIDWMERGQALDRGSPGAWDSRSVFTPNVLVGLDGAFYLYYTGVDEDGGPYNNFDLFNNDSVNDITQIGVARLTFSELGLVTDWTRLNNSEPILSPKYDPSYSGGPALFDSYRVDDASLLLRDFDGDGVKEYGLYYKGRAQGGQPSGTEMGLVISDRPDGGFQRVAKDGDSIQNVGHEVMVWAQGEGVTSIAMAATNGIWYAADGVSFQQISGGFSGTPRTAPGAYRPELVDHGYVGGVQWGIRHTQADHPYLSVWREHSGGLLASNLPGDLNGDATTGLLDLDLLLKNWLKVVAPGSRYDGDLNGDGLVGQGDFDILYANWSEGTVPTSVGGDYNGNGNIDDADYLVWKEQFGSSDELRADGNRNGIVDLADYTTWRDNLGRTVPLIPASDPDPGPLTTIHISVGESATSTPTGGDLSTADRAPGNSGNTNEPITNGLGEATWNNIAWRSMPQILRDSDNQMTSLSATTNGSGEFVDARFDSSLGADVGSTVLSAFATQGSGLPVLTISGFEPNETLQELWFYHLVDDSDPRGEITLTINGIQNSEVPRFATTGTITILQNVVADPAGVIMITSSNYIVAVSLLRRGALDVRVLSVAEPASLNLLLIVGLLIFCRRLHDLVRARKQRDSPFRWWDAATMRKIGSSI